MLRKVLAAVAVLVGLSFSAPALAVSSTVVISQVYGGAGCGTANCSTYKNDFIEVFNRGSTAQNVNGWSVQYSAATGTAWQVTNLPNVTLQPGQYLLVAEGAGANGTNNLPTPDATGTIAMSATASKIALVNTTTALSGSCPSSATIVDFVGVGSTASCNEGGANAPAPSTTNSIFRLASGCTDTDNNLADFTATTANPRNSATALNACNPGAISLSINDVSATEGDSGVTTLTFTVSLSAPADAGGVTFDIATADGTATAPSDYTAKSLTGQTIPAGSSTYTFDVLVNGDTTVEPNETFFVNVTNVTGAVVGDGQGLGTITTDDFTLTAIHDIQGNGATSPLVGQTVTTTGIVTGIRSNGFYIQEPDASVDADPATSEAIEIYTNSAPPGSVVVGAKVRVTGTVQEYVPLTDTNQPPLTEITSPTIAQINVGNALPAPVSLTASFPDPAGPYDQLERIEGMRVSVASLTASAPTDGNVNETNATGSSNGVFYGVVTGVARPFREAGIPAPDPAPSGGSSIPPIPRFDSNPERIRVDSNALSGAPITNVSSGAVITGMVGVLDYAYRTYTILPDPAVAYTVAPGISPTPVTTPTSSEFTVASYNLERFFDTVNDPSTSDAVLTTTAFNNRLAKASIGIRDYLKTPDILAVEEMENLTTLQALADKINNDAVAASQPNPQYAAYLFEGNDVGGIDIGYLVKTAVVGAGTPRVEVVEVVQEEKNTTFTNADNSIALLNDRPPLRLKAVIHGANGSQFPITVIANHLRSLNNVNSEAVGTDGWSTEGARVRAKRQAQAVDLANLVQARQVADPSEHIILVGDFNAFEVNDGLVDSIDVIKGTPVPDNETAVPGDGVDLVNPDLVNLAYTAPAEERYSYTFDGQAQTLDHILVNAPLIADTTARRIEHARINADFPETLRADNTTPTRLSDHDPVVTYFSYAGLTSADLSITVSDTPDPVLAGSTLSYTITVTNNGPDAALDASWSDTLPAGTTFTSLSTVGGWSCTTPVVGSSGTVNCTNASFAAGTSTFTLTVTVGSGVSNGATLSNTATVSTSSTNTSMNTSGTASTVVSNPPPPSADLSTTVTDTPDPVLAGSSLTYTITVANAGPSTASGLTLTGPLPSNTTFGSISAPGGWSCSTPSVGSGGTITCTAGVMSSGGNASFTLVVNVDAGAPDASVISATFTATSGTSDPSSGNNSGTATTTVSNIPAPPSVVPTLQEWALALLGLLLGGGGLIWSSRRGRAWV